jgi:hypothetical protein
MTVTGSVNLRPKSYDFFSVSIPEKGLHIPLEEFVDRVLPQKADFLSLSNELRKYNYIYRGKEFSFDDLAHTDAMEMRIFQFYDQNAFNQEFFNYPEQKIGYALRLLATLDRYLEKARFETIQASRLLDITLFSSNINDKSYYWQFKQRCYNAENAIYSMYSLYEILVLIVYICREDCNGKSFHELSKECHSSSYRKALKGKDNTIYSLIADTTNGKINPKFQVVTEWCNQFKHRGILRFFGETLSVDHGSLISVFVPTEESGLSEYSSQKNAYQYIDLDEKVLPELINYYNNIVELAKQIVDYFRIKERMFIGEKVDCTCNT